MIRRIRFGLLFILVLSLTQILKGQSLPGITGMLNAPSATMLPDGTFYLGANYLNRNYLKSYEKGKYNCLIYYFDLTFLPFLEIDFRSTRELDNPTPGHTVDRMLSAKIQALKEKKYIPAIAIGANDLYTEAKQGNQYFGAAYLVTTKNFEIHKHLLGVTAGYAFRVFKNSQFDGLFGGVYYSPSFLRQLTVIFEYDTKYFNFGGSVLFFKHLYIFAVAQGLESFSGGMAYRLNVYSGFKGIKDKFSGINK